MKSQLNENKKIESTSLRYLDMMGWLIRYLITDNIDLYSLLTKLGIFHQNMGIKIEHFEPMLEAMHETFSYYFEHKYSIEVHSDSVCILCNILKFECNDHWYCYCV